MFYSNILTFVKAWNSRGMSVLGVKARLSSLGKVSHGYQGYSPQVTKATWSIPAAAQAPIEDRDRQ